MSFLLLLMSILVTIVYAFACLGAGAGIVKMFGVRFDPTAGSNDALAGFACLFLAGTALIGAGLTGIGLAGLLRPLPIAVLLAAGFAGLAADRAHLLKMAQAWFAGLRSWRGEPVWLQLLALAIGLLAVGFGVAALIRPPTGDAEAFYLAYAKIMAATGRLEPMPGPYASFSTIGLPGELHYTALMVLGDSRSAKLFVWPIAIAAAAMLSAIVTACGTGRTGRTVAMAILFSSSTFTHYITDGKVDLFAAAFGLAALYWAIIASAPNPPRSALAWTGLFAGTATVAKFSCIPTLIPALAILLAWRNFGAEKHSAGNGPWRQTMIDALQFAFWAALAWLPQIIKNSLLFSAPLAPFIGIPKEAAYLEQVWFSAEVTRQIVLTYPLALVFGRYPMQGGGLSFLLLAFAPLALLLARPRFWRESLLLRVSVAALVSTALWVAFRPSVIAPRYILATLLLFVPLVAHAAEVTLDGPATPRLLRWGMLATIFAAFAAASWHLVPIPGALMAQLTGRSAPCALASDYCAPLQEVARVGGPGERVFLAGYYGYWMRPEQLQCRDLPQEQRALAASDTLLSILKEDGFRFVVVDHTSHRAIGERINALVAEKKGITLRMQTPAFSVYEVPIAQNPVKRCVEVHPGTWKVQEQRP